MTTESAPAPASTRATSGWRLGALVAGDALSFVVFAAAGGSSHGEAFSIEHTLTVAAPFFAGWLLVAPLLGAYRADVLGDPRRMAVTTARAWAIAWPVSLVLRWATAPDHSVPISFAIVILLVNLALLTTWRTLAALVVGRVSRPRESS